ncbi:hypothetical protein VTG60DRAFT_2371 [Thermothelomyces hinnuleus]
MRLLQTAPSEIPQMREFIGSQIPSYAILSHTWGDVEVTLQQLHAGDPTELGAKAGFRKIQQTCALARERGGLQYAWVDTCCIDKTSSAELSEAINSMFAWYRDAEVCYVFLVDLPPGTAGNLTAQLPSCRWFTRGWTLQELLAPRQVLFFDCEWNYRGDLMELAPLVGSITAIPEQLLRREAELGDYAVARRMSWAATRETTRVEDVAYCLLGIFDVNMPLIYGEGAKAFARLQEAIVQTTPDLSIFAWRTDSSTEARAYAGILADSPRRFAWMEGRVVGVRVRKIGGGLYARSKPHYTYLLDEESVAPHWMAIETITFATKLPARFPFFAGPNPVLGNRHSALRINIHSFRKAISTTMPMSHWDEEQRVFFACNDHTRGWCVSFIRGLMTIGNSPSARTTLEVRFLVGCFEWNTGTPLILLANLEDIDWTLISLLGLQLEQLKFENHRQALTMVKGGLTRQTERRGATTDQFWSRDDPEAWGGKIQEQEVPALVV